jgi:hypothetical protein
MYSSENKFRAGTMISDYLAPTACFTGAPNVTQQVNGVVVLNDNNMDGQRPEQQLSVVLTVQSIVNSSLEALADAKDLLKQIGLGDWFEVYFQAHIDDIATEAVPEIYAMIERLEVEAKR